MNPRRFAPFALLAAGAVAGGVLASSLTASAETPSPAPSAGQHTDTPETPLTGDTKSKVEAAVKAKYPGATICGLETSRGGDYEATVTKTDGTSFEVHVSKDFATVTEGHGGRDGHRGGPHGSPETPLTGTTRTKVEAAVKAKYPGATIERTETDNDGVYESHVTLADGSHAVVQVGKDFTVTGLDTRGPGGPGGHRGGPHDGPPPQQQG
jgi:hypothetical protein